MANKDTAERAIRLAIEYELRRLRLSERSRIERAPKNSGYDLKSPDGREIEVKSTRGRKVNSGFRLNSEQEIAFVRRGGCIYRIVDVFDDPKLFIYHRKDLRVSEKMWATVTVPLEKQGRPIRLVRKVGRR